VEEENMCQLLEWDSEFFERRIARATINRLGSESVATIFNWCRAHRVDCLYFLVDAQDFDTVRLAEDNGFRFVDIRLTLETRSVTAWRNRGDPHSSGMRLCTPADIPILRAIARDSYHDTRFYSDTNFPRSLTDALYETWIEKSCRGYAEAVLVIDTGGKPAGYISCHLVDQKMGRIGLVGVAAQQRGKGLGQELIAGSLRWFAERGVTQVDVVTQGRNCQAQRMYQRCGFLTRSVQLWYHRWFTSKGV
jgi:dTDP-4-amino-4,6-dideoxy-D-galactose acyltransferase